MQNGAKIYFGNDQARYGIKKIKVRGGGVKELIKYVAHLSEEGEELGVRGLWPDVTFPHLYYNNHIKAEAPYETLSRVAPQPTRARSSERALPLLV